MELIVCIPKQADALGIAKNSGIVLVRNGFDGWQAYYEGNLYGACNLETWRDRVVCAAGRAYQTYSTTAKVGLTQEQVDQLLDKVGHVDSETWMVTVNEGALARVKASIEGELGLIQALDFPRYEICHDGRKVGVFHAESSEKAVIMGLENLQRQSRLHFHPSRYEVQEGKVDFRSA